MLEVRGLAKSYGPATRLFDALDLDCAPGELVAVIGESGSGKSTLLNILAGLDRPDAGTVRVEGATLDFSDDDRLALWRRSSVGFVFQSFHLLPYLSALENVALPLALNGVAPAVRHERARAALDQVGLAGRIDASPGTLSGGEAQRVAIARALIHDPRLVLADEPTGNLDEENAGRVLDTLRERVKASRAAALLVTHSPRAAAIADRVLRLSGQRLSPA
ncbi:putative ABC transporter ATP-binding protein YknY [Usitatibacter palustris]|uniref:Putative ABC transporter ATP-binding protein YknY n=1 Tax=Usitatibacter palustris TaxID=2732487 RepID=A0A6M4H6S6_9PROT|nr:ABC transporter ATP-binding protein [Usitatibacter palustris]QJR15316.1 putative ABC transporter ATP-binding protein YknY [Usitatibacter palustris]